MDRAPVDDDDPRSVELETLTAIYPEIRTLDDSPFAFELDLPVQPTQPVTVHFEASDDKGAAEREAAESVLISHLPWLRLRFILPDGYPSSCPPLISLSTTPQWISPEKLATLESDGLRLWEEAGGDLVAYTYIDHIQRAAEEVFGAVSAQGTLRIDSAHRLAVLDYDIKAKRAAFEKETWNCRVCLDPKRGLLCHQMMDCNHVFCLDCLKDFYRDAIEQGNLPSVRCLDPDCAKERASVAEVGRRKAKKFISPSELLQIGLCEDLVKRYVMLRYKTELESDKDTVYCPRQWCNGAARSKRHKKPEGLEFGETSDVEPDREDEEDDAAGDGEPSKFKPVDLLCVCEDCGFAFCSRCLQTWHGEFVRCAPKRNKDEVTEEDKASLEYMQLHTSPCPTCNAPAQKTHGCNHMICSRCETHFCYLCSSWLDPANPYRHYNQQGDGKVTSCYMRLWELENGDGDDVGLGFEGGRAPNWDLIPYLEQFNIGAQDDDDDDDDDDEDDEPESEDEVENGNMNNGGPMPRRPPQEPVDARPRPARQRGQAAGRPPRRGGRGRGADRGRRPAEVEAVMIGERGRGRNLWPRGRGRRGAAGGGGGRGRGGGGRGGAVGQGDEGRQQEGDDAANLDPMLEAWVRNFVRLALVDAEDQLDDEDMVMAW
ncbi:hypothetical protein CP533_2937 [Ophiocordyceps camponoti-saundersi (nom. inval.)]|nr:hypothetical protein CP533_2937 [Ophiocordyceps camponoti-saundersi (nom. inval.)]